MKESILKKTDPLEEKTKGSVLVVDNNPEIEGVLSVFLSKRGV